MTTAEHKNIATAAALELLTESVRDDAEGDVRRADAIEAGARLLREADRQ